MLYLFFKQLGFFADFYIPNRVRDGYGLNVEQMQIAHEKGVDLIITVDCGITAIEEVAHAKQLGMDVIVCDHHQPGPEMPAANAILNPKRADCPFPFKELAGVGVAFKLAQGIMQSLGQSLEDFKGLLELVAIGSAADIVPLVGENRILVKAGLEQLNQTENVGLQALMRKTGLLGKKIGTGQIIFMLAPRINAVGRMGDAMRAVRLLVAKDFYEAASVASVLEKENQQRRNLDEKTFREAVSIIEKEYDPETSAAFVLASDKWHPGVIGIAASRLVEKYYRPTVMIAIDNGVGKGSARSISGFNIYEAMESCEDLMVAYGGHKYAAGMSINSENIDAFRQRINAYASDLLTEELLTKTLNIEGEIKLVDITERFKNMLKHLAPFGPQNLRPTFVSKNVEIVGMPAIVGKNHLRFKVRQDDVSFDAIGFNLGGMMHRVRASDGNLSIAYVIDENTWQGRTTTQLRIKDIQ